MEKEIITEEREDLIPGEYGHPIPLELFYRELGINGPVRHRIGRRILSPTLATKAVHSMCTKSEFTRRSFKLPTGARTTFHMAFSSDGARVASCHGDHNVYVCDVASGKIIQTLTGHPRTPWCVVFHPTQSDILASGCLAGHIRVWDLKGGSEVLVTDSGTVIASLAFHPTVRLLAIATFNEIIFWDWGLSHPLARCSTQNTKEKVRLVRFDRLGRNLITGITNFPNPPTRESCAKPVHTSSAGPTSFRPNILSRRSMNGGPVNSGSFYAYTRARRAAAQDENRNTGNSGSDAPRSPAMDNSTSQQDAGTPRSVDVLSNREERFQESYRQLVHHYQDLVSNYQQFLRSRIPRLLETSRGVREPPFLLPQIDMGVANDFDQSPESSSDNSLDGTTATVSLDISPNPVIVPDLPELVPADLDQLPEPIIVEEVAGPSGLSQLQQLERLNRIVAQMDSDSQETPANEIPVANTIELPTSSSNTANNNNDAAGAAGGPAPAVPETSESGLQNIEALAQNIMQMQNLCSIARRDAPTAVENQHIQELQNIRRHLEVLQDQTRELQSSIRATLSSLARGSLEVLNSRAITAAEAVESDAVEESAAAAAQNSPASQILPPTSNPGPSRLLVGTTTDNLYPSITVTGNPEPFDGFSVNSPLTPPNEITGRVSPPITGLMISSSSTAARTRVPPVVPMQYQFREYDDLITSSATTRDVLGGPRTPRSNTTDATPGTNTNAQEPIAGPSRHYHPHLRPGSDTTNPSTHLNRRLVREFQVVHSGRFPEQEHSRNCPFSGRDNLMRPPTRMRCLTEMGESPSLTIWPSSEPDQQHSRRPQRSLSAPDENSRSSERNNQEINNNSPIFSPYLPTFSHWQTSGPNWVNNAIGVRIFLTARQANQQFNDSENLLLAGLENAGDEEWQRSFVAGLGLIPPNIREGLRLASRRSRRGQNIIYHLSQGQGRVFTLRPSQWDEFRSNYFPPNSPSELTPETQRSVELPSTLRGNFVRSFSMRMGDEVIPVYTNLNGTSDTYANLAPGDIRDSPVANVYTFPIGLFLEGNSFTGNPQAIGIYWPPASLEEEEALREFRHTEALIPVTSDSEILERSTDFYRIDYSMHELIIRIDSTTSLVLVQPGLMVLDAVTTVANWPRPRPVNGTIFVSHVSPLLDALERLFGHRMRRSSTPSIITPAGPNAAAAQVPPPPPSASFPSTSSSTTAGGIRMNTVTHPTLLGPRTGAGRSISWVPSYGGGGSGGPPAPANRNAVSPDITEGPRLNPDGSYPRGAAAAATLREDRENRDRASRHARRIITFSTAEMPTPPPPGPGYGGPRNADDFETFRRRFLPEIPDIVMNVNGEPVPPSLTHYIHFSRSRSRSRPTARDYESNGSSSGSGSGGSGSRTSSSTRRFIRFAVDTATAEVLRRHPNASPHDAASLNSVQRAIESRIERVLNERGNRGVNNSFPADYLPPVGTLGVPGIHTENPPAAAGPSPFVPRSSLSWSSSSSASNRTTSTSGTQTTQSFIRAAAATSPVSTSSIAVGPGPNSELHVDIMRIRQGRRRGYPRYTRDDLIEEDIAPPLPPRIARMNTDVAVGDSQNNGSNNNESETFQNSDAGNGNNPDADGHAHLISVMPAVDVRVARRHRSTPFSSTSSSSSSRGGSSSSRNQFEHGIARTDSGAPGPAVSISGSGTAHSPETLFRLLELTAMGRPHGQTIGELNMGSEQPAAANNTNGGRPSIIREPTPSTSGTSALPRRIPTRVTIRGDDTNNNNNSNNNQHPDPAARFYPGYIPEILITPRVRPMNYYTMDAATTAFLSSRIQKWDFSDFAIPDITRKNESVVVAECSLHSDACLDISSDSDFLAVLQPSDNGSYSAVGIYSLREESLGETLYIYHFDQNTVSISIAPSCDYIVVGYAGRGPFYRFVHPTRNIGQILSLTRDCRDGHRVKLIPVKELYAESQNSLMSINCMHFVPIPGYGIIYGTNTGELVLIS